MPTIRGNLIWFVGFDGYIYLRLTSGWEQIYSAELVKVNNRLILQTKSTSGISALISLKKRNRELVKVLWKKMIKEVAYVQEKLDLEY